MPLQWYVDVALALLERAGDFCSDDIWHRVVQLVTNNEGMQEYAAGQMVDVLKRGAAHESLICSAAYVLGEYGRLIKVGSSNHCHITVMVPMQFTQRHTYVAFETNALE